MKKIILDEKKALDIMGPKMTHLSKEIIARIGEIESDADEDEAIADEVDATVVYDNDRWEVVRAYSTPEEPISFAEASLLFQEDILSCISCVNAAAGKIRLVDYKVKRKSDSPTWDANKAEIRSEGGYDGERFESGLFDSVKEAEKAALADWERLEKTDQYSTCYDIERIGEDVEGNDDEIIKTHDFWLDMLEAENEKDSQDD